MNSVQDPIPLWRQLIATTTVVLSVRRGVSGTAAIEAVPGDLRSGVQALSFQVLRNLGRAQALCKLLASRQPPPPVEALLCVGLALAWRADDAPYDMFTLVNQIVEAAKRGPATKQQASFVNACMRRFLRERESLVHATDNSPVARWNFPTWWIQRVATEYPLQWQEILSASNRQAPMTLRVNRRRCALSNFAASLEQAGVKFTVDWQGAIVLDKPMPVHQIPGFDEGWVSVQDSAAQMAAPLLLNGLQITAPLRILDACAAPGGKTGHILELCEAHVTAIEKDPERCPRIHQNLQRLGLKAHVLNADAAAPQEWWDGQTFDAILVDAPCTASGIVRRHPDIRWLRRETDIAHLVQIQKRILGALWGLLRPGGRMLYCTCSIFKSEGSEQVQTFLAHNTDAQLLSSPGHLMPGPAEKFNALPDNMHRDHDGFYYALLEKRGG